MRINHTWRLSLIGCAVISVIGCIDGTDTGDPATARDSAGIEIIENDLAARRSNDVWRVEAEPLASISGQPNRPLFNLVGASRLPDGRIVAANQSSSEVMYFDSLGQFEIAVGRQGDGPGEFRDIAHLAACSADTLVVYDRRTLRATVLDGQGRYARSYTPAFLTEANVWPQTVTCRPDGHSLVVGWGTYPPDSKGPGRRRSIVPVLLAGTEGELLAEIGTFSGSETQHWLNENGSGWFGLAPFAKQTSIILQNNLIVVATADAPEVAEYDRTGAPTRVIRWETVPARVTSSDIDRFEQLLMDTVEAEYRELTRSLLGRVEYPELAPAYGVVIGDSDQNVWVQQYESEQGGPVHWLVFDASGRFASHAETPQRLAVRQIGRDFVLGVEKDEFDVESIVVYRLIK